jgi:hypothetical protein
MAGKYTGFDRLKSTLAKRPGVSNPGALAASRPSIGTRREKK